MIRKIFGLLLILAASTGAALCGAGGASKDPSQLVPVPSEQGLINFSTNGLTLRSQTLNPAIRNLIMVTAGQSLAANNAPTAYVPTNASAIDNFNVTDGAVWSAADPLLGCGTNFSPLGPGTVWLRLADKLITAGKFDRVIIAPVAVDGTSIAQWQTLPSLTNRISVVINRLAAKGFVAGTNATIVVLWAQGESDTALGTTQAAYGASLSAVIATTRSTGYAGLWFVALQTYFNGSFSLPIRAGQASVVDHPNNIWIGPDSDTLVGNVCVGSTDCRNAADPVHSHWSDAGSDSDASLWQSALAAYGAPF